MSASNLVIIIPTSAEIKSLIRSLPVELSCRDVNDRLLTVESCISDQPFQVSPPLLAVVLPTDGQAEVGVVGYQGRHLGSWQKAGSEFGWPNNTNNLILIPEDLLVSQSLF